MQDEYTDWKYNNLDEFKGQPQDEDSYMELREQVERERIDDSYQNFLGRHDY